MPWPGGKSGAGVYHRLLAEVPPHDERISPFLGHCAVMRKCRPATLNVGIDLDEEALQLWEGFFWKLNDNRIHCRPILRLHQADGISWLRQRFCLDRYPPTPDPFLHPEEVIAMLYGLVDRRVGRRHCSDA